MSEGDGVLTGADGIPRCFWAGSSADYLAYHDDEWGMPVRGESALYERLTLEAFQSGLSWLTVLRRRAGFRAAFHGFDADAVARYGDRDRERLLADPRIIRNARKIDAAIGNARAVVALRAKGGLDGVVWGYAPQRHVPPRSRADLRASSPESTALARSLKGYGFVFVGPTTMYATMQACGLVNDHLRGCHRSIGG
jgi:DNA-3-methyladenine glycosylase I